MTAPIQIANGTLSGTFDKGTGIHSFKGIPFAAPRTQDQAEAAGVAVGKNLGTTSLAELRAVPAQTLLEATEEMGA